MKKFKEVQVTTKQISSVTCDICKTTYHCDTDLNFEIQEFLHIDFTGGFNSVFGDLNKVKADICQYCLKDKFHKYLRIESPESFHDIFEINE